MIRNDSIYVLLMHYPIMIPTNMLESAVAMVTVAPKYLFAFRWKWALTNLCAYRNVRKSSWKIKRCFSVYFSDPAFCFDFLCRLQALSRGLNPWYFSISRIELLFHIQGAYCPSWNLILSHSSFLPISFFLVSMTAGGNNLLTIPPSPQ